MFSARNISVCDCLLASRSFGVAMVVDGGRGLMICGKFVIFLGFYIFLAGGECMWTCVCMVVYPDFGLF